jgi:hypothetical protein
LQADLVNRNSIVVNYSFSLSLAPQALKAQKGYKQPIIVKLSL